MADQKISQLTPLTTNPTMSDQFIINHNGNGLETRSITFDKLLESIGSVAPTQYLDFDGGTDINIQTFWIDANNGNSIKLSEKTKKYTAPAKSVGAYVFITARMDSQVCDPPTASPHYGKDVLPAHKLFATCNCRTPEATWETLASEDSNPNTNGFLMRLVTTMPVASTVALDLYGTYHAAKWNYISWTPDPSSDRQFNFEVTWTILRAGHQRVLCGMNRVIIIPVYENPVIPGNFGDSTVDPIPQMKTGSIPSEYFLRDDQLSEFNSLVDEIANDEANLEIIERTHLYSSALDKILRNIEVYKQNLNNNDTLTDDEIAAEIVALDDIRDQCYATRTLTKLSDAEKAVFEQTTGLYDQAKDIIGVTLPFEELPTTFTSF